MNRNLDRFAETGKSLLKNHRQMDLSVGEICDTISAFDVAEYGDIAYKLLTYGFAVGVEVGHRIAKEEQKQA